VGPIRIRHEVEWLAELDQTVHQKLGALIVHVIVPRPVDNEEIAFETLGEVDRRTLSVAIDIRGR
jgi:hypothetical protein